MNFLPGTLTRSLNWITRVTLFPIRIWLGPLLRRAVVYSSRSIWDESRLISDAVENAYKMASCNFCMGAPDVIAQELQKARENYKKYCDETPEDQREETIDLKRINFSKTHLTLDLPDYQGMTYTLTPENILSAPADQKIQHVVVFAQRNQRINTDVLDLWAAAAYRDKVRITVIEHPGIIARDKKPAPKQFSDLVDNGEEVVRALQKKYNLDMNKIGLYGHSLGGAIAIETASRVYEGGKCPHVLADRTFSSISRTVIGFILSSKPEKMLGWMTFLLIKVPLAMLTYAVVKPVLLLGGWESNAGLHYANLPADRKNHLFVSPSEKQKKQLKAKKFLKMRDETVSQFASLDSGILLKISYWSQKYYTKWFKSKEIYEMFQKNRKLHKLTQLIDEHGNQKEPGAIDNFHGTPLLVLSRQQFHQLQNISIENGMCDRAGKSGPDIFDSWVQDGKLSTNRPK